MRTLCGTNYDCGGSGCSASNLTMSSGTGTLPGSFQAKLLRAQTEYLYLRQPIHGTEQRGVSHVDGVRNEALINNHSELPAWSLSTVSAFCWQILRASAIMFWVRTVF